MNTSTITLNAFTNGFHGWQSTTGVGTPRRVRWVYAQQNFAGVTLFEDGWMYAPEADAVRSAVRLGWLVEPRSLRPENYERAMDVRHKFDAILTYDAALLAADPARFRLCPRMGLHVSAAQMRAVRTKTQGVAMIATQKTGTPGHAMRRGAAGRFGDVVHPLMDVYGGSVYVDKVQALGPYRFAVVAEAERADNWFTDHLLDAIALGCVPVYWGAPNIGEWLDEAGVLQWRTLDELGALLAMIAERGAALYTEMLPALRRNHARLPEYAHAEDWLAEHVLPEFTARLEAA